MIDLAFGHCIWRIMVVPAVQAYGVVWRNEIEDMI